MKKIVEDENEINDKRQLLLMFIQNSKKSKILNCNTMVHFVEERLFYINIFFIIDRS